MLNSVRCVCRWACRRRASHQILQQWPYLGCKPFELLTPALIRAREVQRDMTHAGVMKFADALGNLFGRTDRAIPPGRRPHVPGIADASRLAGRLQSLLVIVAEPGDPHRPGGRSEKGRGGK